MTLLLSPALRAQQPTAADQQAVLAPVQAMFDGMAKHDKATITASFIPGGELLYQRNGTPQAITLEAFTTRIAGLGDKQIAERMHDPIVHVDNDLAVVWTRYEFLIDGKVDHCGTDLFNLVKTSGGWKIAGIVWNNNPKDCTAQ